MIRSILQGNTTPARLYFLWFGLVEIGVGFILFTIVSVIVGGDYAYPNFESMRQFAALVLIFFVLVLASFIWVTLLIRAFWYATRLRRTELVFVIWGLGTMCTLFVINAGLLAYACFWIWSIIAPS